MRLERQIERLTSTLAAEADQRRRLEQRLDGLATELAALRASDRATPHAVASNPESGSRRDDDTRPPGRRGRPG